MIDILKKYNLILSQEESFARAVASGFMVRRPLVLWHLLIPFMFVFHLITFKKEIENFAKNFLFTRKLALKAAQEITQGISKDEDKQNKMMQIADEIKDWLMSQKLYSTRLHHGQIAQVNLLIDHYSQLLNAEGDNYYSLVRNAYLTRSNYEAFQRQLTLTEKEIDTAVFVILGETNRVWEQILTKQRVIEELRTKETERIFFEE